MFIGYELLGFYIVYACNIQQQQKFLTVSCEFQAWQGSIYTCILHSSAWALQLVVKYMQMDVIMFSDLLAN